MNLQDLTIFTEPPPVQPGLLSRYKTKMLSPYRVYIKGIKNRPQKKYAGHEAVTRSLLHGLEKIKARYNYNPAKDSEVFENVIHLSGVNELSKTLALKKKGKIKLLLVGPNIVDHVLDHNAIVADPLIDYFVVPSLWVKDLVLKDCPALVNRILVWAAGVDTLYWNPHKNKYDSSKVLVYQKTETADFTKKVLTLVSSMGFRPVLIEYGRYSEKDFRKELSDAFFSVFISRSESQGIALAEAWSMNVPTLVFNPGNFIYMGKQENGVSACPYLTEQAGADWKTMDELKKCIEYLVQHRATYKPRKYVLENFSDERSAIHLLSQIEVIKKSSNVFSRQN